MQRSKGNKVANYVNFASDWLLPAGDRPPGLGQPDQEKEDDALLMPSYEAWKVCHKKWATVAVQVGQVSTDFVKLYNKTIKTLITKVDEAGNCQTIVWQYDVRFRKHMENVTRKAEKERGALVLERLAATKQEDLWGEAYKDWRQSLPEGQDPPNFLQEDQKRRVPDMTKEKVEERRETAKERKREQDQYSKVSKANAHLLVNNNARFVSHTAGCSRTAFTREWSKQHGKPMPKYERKHESDQNSLNEARSRSNRKMCTPSKTRSTETGPTTVDAKRWQKVQGCL